MESRGWFERAAGREAADTGGEQHRLNVTEERPGGLSDPAAGPRESPGREDA